MWTKGTINGYEYSVKHFEEGSEFGIDNGRISKLMMKKNGVVVVSYERGWDIKPADEASQEAFEAICEKYN